MINDYLNINPEITTIKYAYKRFTNTYLLKNKYNFIDSKIVIRGDINKIESMSKIILDYSNKNIYGLALFMVKDTFNINDLNYYYDETQSNHQVQLIYRFDIDYLSVFNIINNNNNKDKLLLPHIYNQFVPSLISMNNRNYKFVFVLNSKYVSNLDNLIIYYLIANNKREIDLFTRSSHEYLNRRIITYTYNLPFINNTHKIPIENNMSLSYMIITAPRNSSNNISINLKINTVNNVSINQQLLVSNIDSEYDLSSCNFDTYIYDSNSNLDRPSYQPNGNIYVKENSEINIFQLENDITINITYVMYDVLCISDTVKLLYKHKN